MSGKALTFPAQSLYMFRLVLSFLLLLSFQASVHAQSPANTINVYGNLLPAEKMHIHFDKDFYLPGETIWFKAYILEEYLPSSKSTNLYISLYLDNGKALQQKVLPIFNGTADGHFEIPDTLKSNQLICRAFTGWMLNFNDRYLFSRPLSIYQPRAGRDSVHRQTGFQFFPEGGDLLVCERNSLAFKANFGNGLPYNLTGYLKSEGSTGIIDTIRSIHDGMGRFDLIHQPGEQYYLEWTDQDGAKRQSRLPDAKPEGVSLKMTQQKNRLFYNIVNHLGSDTLHVLGFHYQKVVFTASLYIPNGDRYTGWIPLDSFPPGVMQLTVFSAGWKPVAERICFINAGKYRLHAGVGFGAISTARRGRNHIEINMPDSIPASLSLSVTDADLVPGPSGNNIMSDLLLSGSVRGYVHNPAYYFSGDPLAATQLDLVMLTNGWRRYNWDELFANPRPQPKFPVDDYLMVYGQVSGDLLPQLKKEESVTLVIRTADSSLKVYSVRPDEKGFLKAGSLIFYDTAKLYYSFNTEKKYNRQMTFSTHNYTLSQPAFIANFRDLPARDTAGAGFNKQAILLNHYTMLNFGKDTGKVKTLQRVVVNSGGWRNWKNDPVLKMDEKYTGGLFRGGATSFSFDVLHDESAWTKGDIYNYLANKIPGLILTYPKSSARGGSSLGAPRILFYAPKDVSTTIFLDEREITADDLETLQLSQVAYIKMIPNFYSTSTGPGGSPLVPALAIYTKKGDDLLIGRPQLTDLGLVKVPGYSPVKEFYSPNYSLDPNMMGNDSRTTLLWLPNIISGKGINRIPVSFYNNDFSKRIRIVLEGFNDEGKLVYIEKMIE